MGQQMMVFRAYTEARRILAVNRVIIDLTLDVFVSKLYQQKGLGKRPFGKRLLAGTIRRLLRRDKSKAGFGIQFRKTLERLGPTYVKLGQILSLRDDLLPEKITRELRKLQSQVPSMPYTEVRKVVEEEFNLPIGSIFKSFEEEPLAAASLAQVHIARLKNGKKVVVKVQRPGIVRLITDDINIMRRIASMMQRLAFLKDYRPTHFVEEFASYTLRELDFTQEGKHADTFRENFKGNRQIIFPEIYWSYTSRRVLTMQYIDGIKPDDSAKLKKHGIDGKRVAEIGAKALVKMLYVDGFFHGDPHPGNMLIVGRSKIAFLDLGMIGQFNKEVMRNMFLYLYYLVMREYDIATKYIVNLTQPGPKADVESFRKEMQEVITRWSGAKFSEYSMGRVIFETMNIGAKHQLYFHGDLVLSSKAVLTVEAVANILDPEMDFGEIVRPMMEEMFVTQFSPLRVGKSVLNSLPDYIDFFEKLPSNLLKTLNMVSSGKLQVQLAENSRRPREKKRNAYLIFGAAALSAGLLLSLSDNAPGQSLIIGTMSISWMGIGLLAVGTFASLKGLLIRKNND